MEVLLEIRDLTFGYDKSKPIFKDFNLTLKRGEVVSIVGKSGVGKSTLFSLICGEIKPQKGDIKAKKVSQIFQDPYSSFHPSYTIINQIEDVAEVLELDAYLEELDLKRDLLLSYPKVKSLI